MSPKKKPKHSGSGGGGSKRGKDRILDFKFAKLQITRTPAYEQSEQYIQSEILLIDLICNGCIPENAKAKGNAESKTLTVNYEKQAINPDASVEI